MKYTVKNLINSPYDVITVDGPQRIPARGELTAEFTPQALVSMRQMGYFQIAEYQPTKKVGVTEEGFAIVEKDGPPVIEVSAPRTIKRGPGRPKKAD